ncbi:MAG TPA: hypothetical protein VF600_15965 [Abditibacteriaceae bacterium]|jgi:ribosomal protein L31
MKLNLPALHSALTLHDSVRFNQFDVKTMKSAKAIALEIEFGIHPPRKERADAEKAP